VASSAITSGEPPVIDGERTDKRSSLRWLDTAAEIGVVLLGSRGPNVDPEGDAIVNKVFLTGRLTRDPELRSLASGKAVTTFSLATNEYPGGKERTEYHNVVTWDRLAEICGQFLV
jgi:Single-strand binding protein family